MLYARARLIRALDCFILTKLLRSGTVKIQMGWISSAALLVLMSAFSVLSQTKVDAYGLSISVDESTFAPGQQAKVKARLENQTGHALCLNNLRSVSFELAKQSKPYEECHRSDCFGASFPLKGEKELKSGESVEFEVDLADLYWKDLILSGINFQNPKNMFEEVPSGDYYLSMELHLPAENSTKEDPRVVSITSNKILVKMRGK